MRFLAVERSMLPGHSVTSYAASCERPCFCHAMTWRWGFAYETAERGSSVAPCLGLLLLLGDKSTPVVMLRW